MFIILIYFEKLFVIYYICTIILIQMDFKSISHVAKFRSASEEFGSIANGKISITGILLPF